MGCCLPDSSEVDDARTACRDVLFEAVTSQIVDRSANPTLVDAIPSIGKTTAAAQFAAELCQGSVNTKLTYLTHRTPNREQFERMVRNYVDDDSVVDVTHLPVLEEDCETATGTHGKAWQSRLLSLRDQGLSPSSLHRHAELGLPCGGSDCPYMEWWSSDESSELLIGHLTHAYIPEVISDRVVIVDEDPEDAYQTRFSADELHQLTREFLDRFDDPPATDLDELKLLRKSGTAFNEARDELLRRTGDTDRYELGQEILNSGRGHVSSADIVQAYVFSPS